MMTHQEIETKLLGIFQNVSGQGHKIESSSHIYDDLELDSVGLLTLASEVENQFHILLPESEDEIPQTVGEFVEYIYMQLQSSPA